MQAVSERLAAEDVRVRPLRTGQAFHSAMVEPALDALEAGWGDVAVSPPAAHLVST